MEAKLVVIRGKASKRDIPLKLPTVIGRSRQADLPVAHALVSRQHCQLFERDGMLVVKDNGSLNGTFVGGQRVDEMNLRPGDELTVGPLTFQVYYDSDEIVPTQDATSTPADDSTVATPPKKPPVVPVPAIPAPADPSQSRDKNASPFDFLESEAAVPTDQPAAEAPDTSAPAGPPGIGDIEFGDVELGDPNEPLSLPEPRVAQEATLQWSDEHQPLDEIPAIDSQAVALPAAAVRSVDVPPIEATVALEPVAKEPVALEPVAKDAAIVASPPPAPPVEADNDAEPADFFASLALEEASPSTTPGNAETEFFIRPPSDTHPEPEVRDDDSTIGEAQPGLEPIVAVSQNAVSKNIDQTDQPPQSVPQGKKKGSGWWPFGKKKADTPVSKKPIAQTLVTTESPAQNAVNQEVEAPEFSNQSDFEPAVSPTSDLQATAGPPNAVADNTAPEVLVVGVPNSPPGAAADDLVAGWLADDELPSGPSASGSDLNNFLTNFPK